MPHSGTARTATDEPAEIPDDTTQLSRTLTLPLLVFYGVGVTVGAGIFALIGEILAVSGNQAPLAFLVAGAVAGVTGLSYMQLVRQFPKAGGEAVWVARGLGTAFGRAAGMGVVVTGTISSAVVALAFGGYLSSLTGLNSIVAAVGVVLLMLVVAVAGVKQSIWLAAAVTVVEVGTLVVIATFGIPKLGDANLVSLVSDSGQGSLFSPVLSGAVVAFFAFIGFEDIANMAEETQNPSRTAPRAIAWTLGISIVIYVLLASIAVVLPDRQAIVDSQAPMATLFEQVSGRGADVVSAVASIAMTNGILVQIVMASRVLYGMANEKLLPAALTPLAEVHPRTRTPVRATVIVCAAILSLVVVVPLGSLARLTSLVTLAVFTVVNFALFRLGSRDGGALHRWRLVGLGGAGLALALGVYELLHLANLV